MTAIPMMYPDAIRAPLTPAQNAVINAQPITRRFPKD